MNPEVVAYQFDDVVIEMRAGRVRRAGLAVPLEPKAYDLLILLVSRRGELVTRQQVLDEVWAGVYVTDNAVARVVAQLRRGLGDTARGARYIETVPTRGYRFIGPAEARYDATPDLASGNGNGDASSLAPSALPAVTPGPAADGRTAATADGTPVTPPPAHPFWAAALAALALLALFLAWRSQHTGHPPAAVSVAASRVQVTSAASLDAFPAWSPDGRSLAYASDRHGRFEIFVLDLAAGGARIALTSDRQHNVQPAWSPNGAQVAYHSSGRGGIWVIGRQGGAPVQLTRFGSRPVWSPDGSRIAFQGAPYTEPSTAAFESFGPSSLWVVDSAGGKPRLATRGWRPEGSHVRPTWFPDGRRLFFASQRVDTTAFWTVDLDSGALTAVLEAGGRAVDVTLTPDGRAAYYVRLHDHFDMWKLPLTEAGGAAGAPQLVLPPSELDVRHLAVSPDGDRLAYVGMATVGGLRSLPLRRDGMPAGPSARVAEGAVRSARRPSFSPDARLVALERQAAGAPPGLWLLDLARGVERPLTAALANARDPSWSRDGQRVYFESGYGDDVTLRAVRIGDGQVELVTRLAERPHPLLRPRVSPDGTRLAYTRSTEGQLEVWVRTLADGTDLQVARLGDGVAFPVWSPDGRALAVDVWREGHAQAFVVELGSGTLTQISRDVAQAWVRSWSPDGTRVAFAGAREGRWNVWSAGRDGSGLRQMTDYGDEHHYVRNPEWSPTGDRLVYEFASFSGNVWTVQLR